MSEPRLPPLRPEPIPLGALPSRALAIYRAHPVMFPLIALVTALPVGAFSIAAALAYPERSDRGDAVLAAILQIVPVALIFPISAVAATVATIAIVNGRRPSIGAAFEPVGERFWPLAAVLVIYTAAVIAGWLAFILPGVFALVAWLFASRAVVVERLPVRGAFLRSWELVRGAWWRTLAGFLVVEILANIAIFAVLQLVGLGTHDLSRTPETVTNGAAAIIITSLVLPFEMIGVTLLYLDRRVRLEGRWPAPVQAASSLPA
jgi:hypothetical protein